MKTKYKRIYSGWMVGALAFSVAIGIAYQSGQFKSTEMNGDHEKEKREGEIPGGYEQWFEMRKNAQGIIPSGLHTKWYKHDKAQHQALEQQQKSLFSFTKPYKLLGNVTELGPFDVGGRTRAICVDVADTNHYLVGAATGGLWQSFDRGATWAPQNDAASNLSVTCIVQDPFDDSTYYYGTGEYTPVEYFAYSGEGIFKSTDGGQTFMRLSASDYFDGTATWSLAHSQIIPGRVYVGTQNKGLRVSSDGGETFQLDLQFWGKTINDIEALPNGDIVITVHGDGIYRSEYNPLTNDNDPFIELMTGLPNDATTPDPFTRIEIGFCEGSPNVIYAMYAREADFYLGENYLRSLHKSTDGGDSWSTLNEPVPILSFGWYCMMVGVNPDNSDQVVIGMNNAFISYNGGNSWGNLNTGHADNHTLVNVPGSSYYLEGNDGGIYRMNWDQAGREDLNNGYHVTQFYAGNYAPEGDTVLTGSQDNGTFYNGDGTFSEILGGDGGFCAISLQDPEIGYVEQQYGTIYRVENLSTTQNMVSIWGPLVPSLPNVDSWLMRKTYNNFVSPFEINRTDGQQVYFGGKKDLFRTTNGGNNWTKLANLADFSQNIYAVGITEDLDPKVYFGGTNAELTRITNAASASPGVFDDLSPSVPANVTGDVISCITPHKTDERIIYVTFSTISDEPRVYRVVNAHTNSPTWQDISGNLPEGLPVNWIEVNPGQYNQLFVATDFGVYSTMNGGVTWVKETSIPNVLVYQLRLRKSDGKLFAFTFGRGTWVADTKRPYATLPYSTSFEGSTVDRYWSLHATNYTGRSRITSSYGPYEGDQHLVFDNTNNTLPTTNAARLHLDLQGQSNVHLVFHWKEFIDEQHYSDGVYFSDDGGENFVKVASMGSMLVFSFWNEVDLDVSTLAAANGLLLTSEFVVKFQQLDDYPVSQFSTSDGIAIDDIHVFSATVKIPLREESELTPPDEQVAENILVYPNPVKDRLNLQLDPLFIGKPCELKILNMEGRVVFQHQFKGEAKIDVPFGHLNPGTYLLHLRSSGVHYEQKVLKQ